MPGCRSVPPTRPRSSGLAHMRAMGDKSPPRAAAGGGDVTHEGTTRARTAATSRSTVGYRTTIAGIGGPLNEKRLKSDLANPFVERSVRSFIFVFFWDEWFVERTSFTHKDLALGCRRGVMVETRKGAGARTIARAR